MRLHGPIGWKIILLACSLAASATALAGPTTSEPAQAVAQPMLSAAALPAGLRPALYQSLAKDAGAAYVVNQAGCATLPRQGLRACFDRGGARFAGGGSPLALRLAAWGRSGKLAAVTSVEPNITGDQVTYDHGNLHEWWRVLPIGFEQGFTIEKRPAGSGKLRLALVSSAQHLRVPPRHFRDSGKPVKNVLAWRRLRYGQLAVTDAMGKFVPATLTTEGGRIQIAVNDAHAAYPLTVDPLVWLEQEVTPNSGDPDEAFGFAVAMSGTTALVGAPAATVNGHPAQGAAYVFTEVNGVWTQTQKLVAGDGATNDQFGYAVALNGTTAIVGALDATINGNDGQGAVYVFDNSGGNWTQTDKLSAGDGAAGDNFGYSVALDGTTALLGAPLAAVSGHAQQGAAYIFGDSGAGWTQTQKLSAGNGGIGDNFGTSVALEGTIALVGAPFATVDGNSQQGAAYVFGDSGGTWTQTQKLGAGGTPDTSSFGSSVALVGPGALIDAYALIGAPTASVGRGAAYVFTDSGGTWTREAKLSANDGVAGDKFGTSVAASGTTALVGADLASTSGDDNQGAAYLFVASAGTWEETQKFTASDGAALDNFGWSLSLDGGSAIIGTRGTYKAYFEDESNLGLAMSTPQTVGKDRNYVSQTIATNNASVASAAVAVTVAVPAAASFVSATATQGSCGEASGTVTCDFGAIDGNAGTATASVTLKAVGGIGATIENTAGIAHATPALTASASTVITACPQDYLVFEGMLAAGWQARSPGFRVAAGTENVILRGPPGFQLYVTIKNAKGTKTYRIPGNESHKWGPAGKYTWIAQAGDTGGSFVFCLQHP